MKVLARVISVALVTAACTSTSPAATSSSASSQPSSTPTASLSPSPPPKPSLAKTRLAGQYEGTLIVLQSTASGSHAPDHVKWTLTPICQSGPCNVVLRSKSGGYHFTLAFQGHRYAGEFSFPPQTCAGEPFHWDENYRITPTKAALFDGVWIVTVFKVLVVGLTVGSGGCLLGTERDSAVMKRHFR